MTRQASRVGAGARGGPLVTLVLLLLGWGTARVMWWESPFGPLTVPLDPARLAAGPGTPDPAAQPLAAPLLTPIGAMGTPAELLALPLAAFAWRAEPRRGLRTDPRVAAAHHRLRLAAVTLTQRVAPSAALEVYGPPETPEEGLARPPFLPVPAPAQRPAAAAPGRWSLDAWAFWRQGSDAAPVSQGRVPIYGASQTGAVLHYRLAPADARDPRLFARAYRALVRRGENEFALGASVRPLGRVPLRAVGELRYTDAAFSNALRPAAYVVTEIAPLPLAFGTRLEAYGQAGWVGGPDPTGFADGQASVTGELREVARASDDRLRLSLGAAAWGGAQKDAQRIDIGPTLRLDFTLGDVPARVSIDWRERVGGDAGPESGLAATLSAQF